MTNKFYKKKNMKNNSSRKYIRTLNHITTIVANYFLLMTGYRDVETVRFETFESLAMSPEEPLYFKLLEEFDRLGIKDGTDYTVQDRTAHDGLWVFVAKTIKVVHTANRVLEMTPRLAIDENFRIELDKEYQFPADSELFALLMEAFYDRYYVEQVDYTYAAKEYPSYKNF